MDRYLPITININKYPVLVIGAGRAAAGKIKTLLRFKAAVTVVAPRVHPRIEEWSKRKRLRLYRRRFEKKDLDGFVLVYACTDDPKQNKKITLTGGKKKCLVNCAGHPEESDFHSPAVWKAKGFDVAVSTRDKTAGSAQALRDELRKTFSSRVVLTTKKTAHERKQ